uniref:ubiquitinyl hydrolase 1 n=1 Tax=Globisporangium ultimum (strain ATCC 200006 / CBS 805.95 / DAOM BR144) TaxID=431595 RepID=K3WE29_GLOUD
MAAGAEDPTGSAIVNRQLNPHEILLFIKFYDVKKPLGDRLEYMGNIVIDARKSGAELAKYLHEALHIPFTTELTLYEEIQPLTVSEIEMDTSLEAAEIQNGDIICYQYAEDSSKNESVEKNASAEKYPDVPLYFLYLLDRVEIAFCRYGYPQEEESFSLVLLYSNVYDEIIDAVAAHLGFPSEKRLYLRLYQHSPLNGLPKKNPLRHSKYSGGNQTTLDEFLTDYQERTNIMYYEILTNPITEIEAKKQVLVYFSIYDDIFVDQNAPAASRRMEYLVLPNATVKDVLKQITQTFEVPEETVLRVCEVLHGGTMIQSVLDEDTSLSKYWMSSSGYGSSIERALFVEKIHEEEILAEDADSLAVVDDNETNKQEELEVGTSNELLRIGVVHFNFQSNTHIYIHPHGVPFVVHFRLQETVRDVKTRIRKRRVCISLGVPEEVFSQWNFAVVKELKASLVNEVYSDMDAETIDNFPMAHLEEVCGAQFEDIMNFGLEHADPKPATPKYNNRRQEQGIRIRQN